MIPGETIRSGASPLCCGKKLEMTVLRSNAGYYVGTRCPQCGPYSRESHYYHLKAEAEVALKSGAVDWRT
jgi:hypothetical protein